MFGAPVASLVLEVTFRVPADGSNFNATDILRRRRIRRGVGKGGRDVHLDDFRGRPA